MAFLTQKIIANTKTEITVPDFFKTMTFTNTDASADVTIDVYITEQLGTKLRQAAAYENTTPTKVNLSAGYVITSSSQAIVVDTTNATDDIFLNEKVWLSTGALVGTCTAVGSTTGMTFGGGLKVDLPNNTDLYTGARFYILNNVVIPNGSSLQLTSDDIGVDSFAYKMYIQSGDSDGQIDIITRNDQ
tara:strand:+ start:1118 stop:1681 length:564 start_codon:yes stop_codon:yes gene_type:complete